jgi:hypothetical protein
MTDDEFLREFEATTIPLAQWTHRAHLKVAYLFLCKLPLTAAIDRMRAGIRAYNAANGIVDAPDRGYHETVTVAWMRITSAMLAIYGPAQSADAFLDAQPQLGEKNLLRLYYSPDLIMSPIAKTRFVEPDLSSLPRHAFLKP